MKALIQIKREKKWFVATDLITYVADQGKTKEEATNNLRVALREHYRTLFEIAKKKHMRFVENINIASPA